MPIGPIRFLRPKALMPKKKISNKRLVDAIAFLAGISTMKSRISD
jgi:hypothetical protein